MIKQLSLYLQAAFYMVAGLNHFVNPEFYLSLIPAYLPWHETINWTSGGVEIILGIGLLVPYLRQKSALLILLMLIAFIPSHIYFIQVGSCTDALCVDPLIAWLRLLLIHPLLLLWAYSQMKSK